MARSIKLPLLMAAFAAFALASCSQVVSPHLKPIPPEALALMAKKDMRQDAPIFMRLFKEESELEIWKAKADGRFHHFKTYPICTYSGDLGPKRKQGDKQAPEGFYRVSQKQMNPNSSYHLSFNLGYPNAFDKAHNRTGDYLMVHGDCKSAGCYAMTDALIEEIYAIAREAFEGGQEAFQVHAYPFRMTPENMRRHRQNRNYAFWRNLKEGYDQFESTHIPPKVAVCEQRYLLNVSFLEGENNVDPGGSCPPYEKMPVDALPAAPAIQEAKSDAPAPSPRESGGTAQTAAARAAIGGGSTFGFGPPTPSASSFAFKSNSILSR